MRKSRRELEPTAELERYHARLAEQRMAPLWQRLGRLLTREPEVASLPYLWHYDGLRSLLLESAELISAEEAERRVLILENPGLPESSAISESLFAGLQIVMPGEIARSHRHSPAALRFIIEGDGAYTSVDGEQLPMYPGDLILTPAWRWHDHGHEGAGPFVWLDVLDLPTVRRAGAVFFEEYAEQRYPQARPAQDSLYRFGANMRPIDGPAQDGGSLLLTYSYERTREALEHLEHSTPADACHGLKMEYTNPASGEATLPTISTFIQLLPRGFESAPYRSTDSKVYCVIEGAGTARVGDGDAGVELRYAARDIFVVPCWQSCEFVVDDETVLFSASDRAAQTRLGFWREHRGTHTGR